MTERGEGGKKRGEGRPKGRNRCGKGEGRESGSSLIGRCYLEECKVGLDSVGYLQRERDYTLLIGWTAAALINQHENRRYEEGRAASSDGWGQTSGE